MNAEGIVTIILCSAIALTWVIDAWRRRRDR